MTNSFFEEFLPTQAEYMKLAPPLTTELAAAAVYATCVNATCIRHPLDEYKIEFPPGWSAEQMSSNPISLRLLQMLIQLTGAKRILEIGTFVGISAMYFADAAGLDSRVVTIEKGEEFAALARRNLAANRFSNVVVMHGDAVHELVIGAAALPRHFDFAFIDGDKANYPEIFDLVVPLVRSGGLIVVDDALFHGDVLNATPSTDKGRGCKRMLEKVQQLHWQKLLLPLANGMLILVKP